MSAPALLLIAALDAHAGAQGSFDAGVAADRAGDYAVAEQHFREALTEGGRDPAVYHGLGNALYRQDRLGLAIAAWRRGLNLAPHQGDLAANLDQARAQTRDRLDPPTVDVGPFFWQRSLSVAQSAGLASGSLTVLLGLALLRRLARTAAPGRLTRLSAALGGWVLPLLSALGALLFGASTAMVLRERPGAVVVVPEVEARSTLGADGVGLFALHEGAEVRVLESSADAALIALPDERKGWVSWRSLASADPAAPFPDLAAAPAAPATDAPASPPTP